MAKDINWDEHTGAKGGPALGRTRDFLKEPSPFQTDSGPGARQDYAGKSPKPKGKEMAPVKPRC